MWSELTTLKEAEDFANKVGYPVSPLLRLIMFYQRIIIITMMGIGTCSSIIRFVWCSNVSRLYRRRISTSIA
jgi:hypothetical protein